MTTSVIYTGTTRPFFELSITGKPGSWWPQQIKDCSDADAALLVASGAFARSLATVDANADSTDGIAVPASVTKGAILVSGTAGATSGWVSAAPYPERYGLQLVSGTAGVVIEGSNDSSTVAGTILTASLDTVGSIVSTPINHPYLYIRATVQSGAGVVNVTRGA